MSIVKLRRADTGFSNRNARLRVLLDGEPVAKLVANQPVELEVAPGRHAFAVKVNWITSRSYDFNIQEAEHLRLKVQIGRGRDFTLFVKPSRYLEILVDDGASGSSTLQPSCEAL